MWFATILRRIVNIVENRVESLSRWNKIRASIFGFLKEEKIKEKSSPVILIQFIN